MTPNESPKYGVRDAFRKFFPAFLKSNPDIPAEKKKAGACISECKTGKLGYNVSVCEECGQVIIRPVSCNNRSCPCCQSHLVKKWEEERNLELIKGCAYFHVVFTVPHELIPLFLTNLVLLLNLLFKCVHETLLTLCADKRHLGAKPGIVSVLHTWGQKLNFHPHIHVCISGGGITPDGRFVEARHRGFFLPEAAIASMFRGKFLCRLKELYEEGKLNLALSKRLQDAGEWQKFIDSLFAKRWMPFVKETFNGNGNAIRYLARYSYRTAIANSRIVSVGGDDVTFRYKDYADGGKEKTLTLKGVEFVKRFLMHVLPQGFHRVRFAGYLANASKTKNLKLIHRLRNTSYQGNPFRKMRTKELLKTLYGRDACTCPSCRGQMIMCRFPGGPPPDPSSPLFAAFLVSHCCTLITN